MMNQQEEQQIQQPLYFHQVHQTTLHMVSHPYPQLGSSTYNHRLVSDWNTPKEEENVDTKIEYSSIPEIPENVFSENKFKMFCEFVLRTESVI